MLKILETRPKSIFSHNPQKEIIKMNFLNDLQEQINKRKDEIKILDNQDTHLSKIKYKENSKEKEQHKKLRNKIKLKEVELKNRSDTLKDREKEFREVEDNIYKLEKQRQDIKRKIQVMTNTHSLCYSQSVCFAFVL